LCSRLSSWNQGEVLILIPEDVPPHTVGTAGCCTPRSQTNQLRQSAALWAAAGLDPLHPPPRRPVSTASYGWPEAWQQKAGYPCMAVKLRPGCRSSKGRHTKRTPTLVVRGVPDLTCHRAGRTGGRRLIQLIPGKPPSAGPPGSRLFSRRPADIVPPRSLILPLPLPWRGLLVAVWSRVQGPVRLVVHRTPSRRPGGSRNHLGSVDLGSLHIPRSV
jgi:hypothetical protein